MATQSAKLVLLGESAVGKSSLVLRFVRDEFSDFRESTIGAAFLTQTCKVEEKTVKFEIWDTAGQERYKSLAPIYYRNAQAAIVTYDITSAPEASFEKAKTWIASLRRQADPALLILLCGNKLDLATSNPENRRVPKEMAEKYALEEGLLFLEASAKTGENVKEVFEMIAKALPAPLVRGAAGAGGAAGGARRDGGVQLGEAANKAGCAC